MDRLKLFSCLLTWAFIASCNQGHSSRIADASHDHIPKPSDTTYVSTGFYFLSDSLHGIKKRSKYSGDSYYISPEPFVSVDEIESTSLDPISPKDGTANALCLKFTPEGMLHYKSGSGDPKHPKLAVIITNQLLYVFPNVELNQSASTCILLRDYSKREIKEMQRLFSHKK